jgi:hypothetical protein
LSPFARGEMASILSVIRRIGRKKNNFFMVGGALIYIQDMKLRLLSPIKGHFG